MARYSGIRNNLNKIKRNLIGRLLMNNDLVKLLYYPTDSDPLNMPEVEDIPKLINKYIFKKPKAPETIKEEGVFIFIKFRQSPSSSGSFRDIDIIFEVIAHNDVVDNLENGDDRVLWILDLIDDEIINLRADEWLGKAKHVGEYEINVNSNFSGIRMIYRITQFS